MKRAKPKTQCRGKTQLTNPHSLSPSHPFLLSNFATLTHALTLTATAAWPDGDSERGAALTPHPWFFSFHFESRDPYNHTHAGTHSPSRRRPRAHNLTFTTRRRQHGLTATAERGAAFTLRSLFRFRARPIPSPTATPSRSRPHPHGAGDWSEFEPHCN